MAEKLVVLGAGGHAKVVISSARAAGFEVIRVLDDDDAWHGESVLGVRVFGPIEAGAIPPESVAVLAIGSNQTRQAIECRLSCRWATVVHPSTMVDPSVDLGEGTVVSAGAVIQPDTKVGRHVILNTSCSVDHDCRIGDFVHIAPGAHIAGGCTVGSGSFVGIGSAMIPGVRVGEWSVVGAGAAVVRDIPDRVVAVGLPARVTRRVD